MEYKFKIIMLGDYSSGKTSIIKRLTDESFNNMYSSTIGVDFNRKVFEHSEIFQDSVFLEDDSGSYKIQKKEYLDNFQSANKDFKKYHNINKSINKDHIKYNMMIWDTSGQEKFQTITSAYYRFISCAIFVFDITNRKSFYSINNWHSELLQKLEPTNIQHFPIILVGNKSDLSRSRTITTKEGEALAHKFNGLYIECSAKNNENIEELFIKAVKLLLFNINHEYIKPSSKNGISVTNNDIDLFNESSNVVLEKQNKCCIIM